MRFPRQPLAPSPVSPAVLDRAETLTEALQELAVHHPDYCCLTLLDHSGRELNLTLATLWENARRVQATLAGAGCQPGEIVLLTLPTGPELLSAYFGALLAGVVPGLVATPSNRFAGADIYGAHVAALVDHSEARLVWADAEAAEILSVASQEGGFQVLRPADAAALPAAEPHPSAPGEMAAVQYSSGSTGRPNGILLSHEAILSNLRASREALGLGSSDVSVNWLPLYHDMGLIDAFLLPLLGGCRTVLIPTMSFMRDPSLWLWAIHRYGGTFAIAPNFAYALCTTRIPDDEIDGLDLGSWRLALDGSEPALATTIERFVERFASHGLRENAVCPVWGLAEGVCVLTLQSPDRPARVETIERATLAKDDLARPTDDPEGLRSVSCGTALPGSRIEIRGEAGERLPDRQVGSVWVCGDSLFSRYHRDPERTGRVLVDGWLDTQDRGYLADRELYFVSREKDLIVIAGEKYPPHDVEEAAGRVPGVRAGCVVSFGVENQARGTEDVAVVAETRLEDDTELGRLRTAIRHEVRRATGLGVRHVQLVPAGGVIKTTSGKLARHANHARYAPAMQEV
jgi:acyl-CoA synthetase (AMP-forming)/AMP-acid ligase II